MKHITLVILFILINSILNAQSVLKIGDEDISLLEFRNILYKNNYNEEITKESLDEYIDLFVRFKLKVKEAQSLGLDTVESFINELEGYRKQLAAPYLRNKEFDEAMLEEAYERIKQDVNVSHILIEIGEDEEKSYDKALDIRNEILSKNISFSDAARKYSSDKSAVNNGGNLGYFTAFMMVYDFETAAYETEIGDVSMPIKTKYGYHLIKVEDKRSAVGQVKVAHIMFKTGKGANKNKIEEANEKANKVLELLNNGEKFADVAERFSEDRSTAVKGGELPVFGVGKMVPKFEEMAFSLVNIGDFSDPFLTDYGWHIIKLLEKKPIAEFSEIKSDIKRLISQDSRSELSKKALFDKLRNSYKVKNRPTEYKKFRKKFALKVSEGNFIKSSVNTTTFLSIEDLSISVNEFAEYILKNQQKGSDIDKMYIDFVDQQLLKYEDSKLEEKYPEYKALLKEYKEGILLFNLTNEKVWLKAVEDTIGLQNFYIKNSNNYVWEDRVNATVYTCVDLSTAKLVKRLIHKKHRNKITDEEILKEVNDDSPLSVQINAKKFVKGDNKYVDSITWKKGISKDIVLENGSYVIVDINELLPSAIKTLDETRGKVISDYQSYLEAEWISYLKSKYSIKINFEVLYSLIK